MLQDVFLAGAVRTPIGSFQGGLSTVPAPRLGAVCLKAALDRAGVPADRVDEVILGNVLSAGIGQNPARQATIYAGLDPSVGSTTVSKVCGSGLKAVMLAAQAIQCGDASVVLAGGMETMSLAPYLLPKARTGYRMGHGELVDGLLRDGLWDVYNDLHMGLCGDRCAERYGLSQQDQDDFAVESYKRAVASAEGAFKDEIVPVEVPGRKGAVTVFDTDEEPQRFDEQKLRALRPAFGEGGTVTAGNASSINDGAAAVAVLSASLRDELGIEPQATLLGYASHSREPQWFTLAPIGAMQKLLERVGWSSDDVDVWEVNEAFSGVPMAAMKDLGIPREKLNVLGGAVAIGHPIGCSGARVLVTLLNAMKHTGGTRGVASLCIGGGEGVAVAVERV